MSLTSRSSWRALTGFGRSVGSASLYAAPRDQGELAGLLERAREERLSVTLRGAGKSYGDAALNRGGLVVDLRGMGRMLAWDPRTGIVEAEPGLTIEGLWRRTVEDGYWPAVVPGTAFPTLGGCVAMNIHGKNNFRVGPFGEHVLEIDLLTAEGRLLRLSRNENADLFRAVVAGLGLLGVVTRVKMRLKRVESGLLRVEPFVARSFDELVDGFERREAEADYLVGWIDAFARGARLGRGIAHRADYLPADEDPQGSSSLHVERQGLPGRIFGVPSSQVWRLMRPWFNDPGIAMLNRGKFQAGRIGRPGHTYLQSHVAFAFLLDYTPDWWLAYGRGGLIQHQLFVPAAAVRTLIPEVLRRCQERGFVSYLAVFKRHRPDEFLLSHGLDGYSLALDFPVRPGQREALWAFAREIADRVLDAGGTFYMAKDALLRPRDFERAYGDRLGTFLNLKRRVDPGNLFTSDLARRLELGTPPPRSSSTAPTPPPDRPAHSVPRSGGAPP